MKYAIRSMFIAPKGKIFLAMDLSQAENWVTAYSAKEETMKYELQNGDIHSATARFIFGKADITKEERYVGKRLNHALSYRMSPQRLFQVFNKDAQVSGVSITLQQAKKYHDRWHDLYKIKQWWTQIEGALSNGRTIKTIYGRSRTFYGRWGQELFKEATAFIPQSIVADHALGAVQPEVGVKGGLVEIWRWTQKNKECSLVHTAHDSIMLEVPLNRQLEICQELKPLFARPMLIHGEQFTIPAEAEAGLRWGEMESLKL